MRVTHEDGHLDGLKSRTAKRGSRAAAKGVVHNLAALDVKSINLLREASGRDIDVPGSTQ
jgi:hypothetical protein